MRRPCVAVVAAVAAVLLGGCAHSGRSSSGEPGLPAASPYLLMVDARTGWAVLPSGSSWMMLRTTDGWASATNVTPPAVPTGGGLLAARDGAGVAVGVVPVERLTVSPVLSGGSSRTSWTTGELPGGLVAARGAVGAGGDSAILTPAGGTLVRRATAGSATAGWTTVTDAARLASGSELHLDGIAWSDPRHGWLTGHGPAGAPIAFATSDAGRTWAVVARAQEHPAAALPPCGAAGRWLMPIATPGARVRLLATTDEGGRWTAGAALATAAGPAAWGCRGDRVWLLAGSAAGDRVFSSTDAGRSWQRRGRAPVGLTDLAPTGGGAGWAVSTTGGRALLWRVSGDGSTFRRTALPRAAGVEPG